MTSLKGQSGEESKIWLVAGCVGGLLGGRRVGIIRHGGKFGLRTWRHCGDKIFTDDVSGPRGELSSLACWDLLQLPGLVLLMQIHRHETNDDRLIDSC